jgi:hypothetical protein
MAAFIIKDGFGSDINDIDLSCLVERKTDAAFVPTVPIANGSFTCLIP